MSLKKKGLQIDCKLLEQRLGVGNTDRSQASKGSAELAEAVTQALETRPMLVRPKWPEAVEQALAKLQQELVEKRGETLRDGELQRLLFDGESAVRERLHTQPTEHEPILKETRKQLYEAGYQPDAAESVLRFRFLNPLLNDILERQAVAARRSTSESIDQLLLHKVWGLLIFIGMMYVVFQSVYSWAGPAMDGIETIVSWTGEKVGSFLTGVPMLQSLIVDGIIGESAPFSYSFHRSSSSFSLFLCSKKPATWPELPSSWTSSSSGAVSTEKFRTSPIELCLRYSGHHGHPHNP